MENAVPLDKSQIKNFFKCGGRCIVRIGDRIWGIPKPPENRCKIRVYYGKVTS